jgi:hypothetical protein
MTEGATDQGEVKYCLDLAEKLCKLSEERPRISRRKEYLFEINTKMKFWER